MHYCYQLSSRLCFVCFLVVDSHPAAAVLVLELVKCLKLEGHDNLMASYSFGQRQICVLSDA